MCDGGVYDDDDFTANDMCCGCDDSTEWWDVFDDDVVVDAAKELEELGYCSAEEYDIDYNPGNDLASVAASSSSPATTLITPRKTTNDEKVPTTPLQQPRKLRHP